MNIRMMLIRSAAREKLQGTVATLLQSVMIAAAASIFTTLAHATPCTLPDGQSGDCLAPQKYPWWYIEVRNVGISDNTIYTSEASALAGMDALFYQYALGGNVCACTHPSPTAVVMQRWGAAASSLPTIVYDYYDPTICTYPRHPQTPDDTTPFCSLSGQFSSSSNPAVVESTRDIICPTPYATYQDSEGFRYCGRALTDVVPEKNLGCCETNSGGSSGAGMAASPTAGNPIHVGIGNKYQMDNDIAAATSFGLDFVRSYNSSVAADWSSNRWLTYFTLGPGWSHTYQRAILLSIAPIAGSSSYATAFAFRGDGKVLYFSLSGGVWRADPDVQATLQESVDANGNPTGWALRTENDELESYNGTGTLTAITDRQGRTRTMNYDGEGKLRQVADAFGRTLDFYYDSARRLSSVHDSANNVLQFAYDSSGNLASVTYPDTRVRNYYYNESAYIGSTALPHALTGIGDENGTRYATYRYDNQGKAIGSEHNGAVDKYAVSYGLNSSSVTDPLGVQRTYTYQALLGVTKISGLSQPCSNCGNAASAATFDANGNAISRTDFNGKKVCYSYELTRNLETARLEGALSSETCTTVLASPPNRPDVRKVTTTWHATYRLPATIVEPAPGGTKTTTFTYDPNTGDLLQKSITAPKNDGTSATVTRTWQWIYYSYGRVHTATDPNNKTTTTTYYADNHPDMGKRGNVATISNPVGHLTQITAYDLNGRPLSTADPNGLVTTLTYHPRGWLTSRRVGTELTVYDYDGVGQLKKVTLPDSSYVQYTYDDAHRLTQINDSLNNKFVYTLDAMGNRIKEEAFDLSSTLARTRQQVYDSLNRLHQSVGAQ